MEPTPRHCVAVVGAGPAGLFAARELALNGVHVCMFNRDIKPGGLAEYGIYPEKHKMKEGLRAQFRQILAMENINYFGNVSIGINRDLNLADLREMGFQAILVTAGAQGTKWLGLPGEHYTGVYHAKDLVYHYNHLPPFSQRSFHIGRRVVIVGVGNVMTDIAHYLISKLKVDEIIAIARRGPGEVKFDKKELELVASNIDMADTDHQVELAAPLMHSLNQDPADAIAMFHAGLEKAVPNDSATRLTFQFLASPVAITGDDHGFVTGLVVENNTLELQEGSVAARGLGTRRTIAVDTVIFAIGDRVDGELGLPVRGSEYFKNAQPRYPVEDTSYEPYDSEMHRPIEGIFLAGWSRKASSGLVGVARKDGINGAKAVLQYLSTLPDIDEVPMHRMKRRLAQLNKPVVTIAELATLLRVEEKIAEDAGLEEFKFSTNESMLEAMGLFNPD